MASRSRLFSKIAKDVDTTGNLTAAAISSDVSFGATVYDSTGVLPYSGNDTGDQAYVKDNNRFYIWDSAGWYNVALINRAPTITSVLDSDGASSPFALSIDGTVTTITITATDSDGDPLTYIATADANFNGLATVTGSGNEFTVTPFSQDSATTASGTITFKATDGINISSNISTFTLNFVSPYWDETVLSIGTNSTNSLNNSTFIDRSTNAHTVTATGSPLQTAFHPYLDYWSVDFDGTDDYLIFADNTDWDFVNSGDFTVDFWMNSRVSSNIAVLGQSGGGGSRPDKWGLYINDTSVGLSAGTIGWHLGSNGNIQGPSFTPEVGTWYHIQCSRASDTWYFFVDGTLLGSASSTARPSVVANTLRIGSDGESYRDFNGHLSNVRIVKGTNLNTTSFTPITEKLTDVTNTVLLTCQSNRFIDNSSNAHSITVSGDPAISAFNPFGQESEYAVGENKGAAYFDGLSYITNNTANLSLSSGVAWSISFWYYSSNTSGTQVVIAGDASGGAFESYFSNGTLKIGSALVAVYVTIPAADLPLNAWTHVAIVKNAGDVATAYVNGISKASGAWSVENPSTGFKIGSYPSQYGFTGYLSDIRWSIGQTDYTSNFTPPTAPVGNTNADLYLPFDNAGIFDKTGNAVIGNNLTTTNTTTKYSDTAFIFGSSQTNLYPLSMFDIHGDFTFEFWLKLGSVTNDYHPLFIIRYNSSTLMAIRFGNGGSSSFGNQMQIGYNVDVLSGVVNIEGANKDTWTSNFRHFAWTRQGSTNRIFIDGIQRNTSTGTIIPSSYPDTTFTNSTIINVSDINEVYFDANPTGVDAVMENFQMLKGVAKYTANFTPPTQTQGRTYQAED